jgi:EAL and modified HD-GYP domain-containing signal transduction protein
MSSTETLPLITLHPAADFNNVWVALLLEAAPPLDNAALARLLNDYGLADILGSVACVVDTDAPEGIDPGLVAGIPPGRMVLRLPVAVAVDPARHAALAVLHAAGFHLMVSGFPAADATLSPAVESLAVSCPGNAPPAGFGDWLRQLPGPHMATGTSEDVCPGFCKFHWLAGHLPGQSAPTLKGDPTARGLLLRLLSLVTSDADADEIEALIKHDPHLSYHLLKLVNSVAFAPGKHIDSFAQAIVLLGRRQLQRWLQLLLYARPVGSATASPLLPRAAQRARRREGLAQCAGLSREMQEHAFMVGMLSLLDVLFASPIADIIEPLHLTADVVQALTEGGGQLGSLQAIVLAGENAPTAALTDALAVAGIARADWARVLIGAAGWAVQIAGEA